MNASFLCSRALDDVRMALRLGYLNEACGILLAADDCASGDPAYLNLVGVACEMRGHWALARSAYGKAIRAGGDYEPAQQNMRRLYELTTFGRSELRMRLGDERPALAALLASLEQVQPLC